MQWSSHLIYFVLLGVASYITQWGAGRTEWALWAAMAPFVVAAVLLRVRFPYALALLGLIEIIAGIGYNVYAFGMLSLAIRRRGVPVWTVACFAAVIDAFRTYRYDVEHSISSGQALLSAVVTGVALGVTPTLIGRYLRIQRDLQEAAATHAARAAFEHELAVRRAASEERERIAHEMHDSLGHLLARLSMQAGAMEVRSREPEDISAAARIRETARSGLVELRAAVRALGENTQLSPTTTFAAITNLVEASRDAGAVVTFDDELIDAASLPPSTGRMIYQVVQEVLTNAHRHAPGAPIRIRLTGAPGAGAKVVAENPLMPGGEAGAGTGLDALRRRVPVLGGKLDARVSQGRFALTVWLPWEVAP